jgi:acetoin utilization protein AcuB
MFVRDYMTKNPITIPVKTEVREAFYLLKKHGFRQFPVVEEGKLVGIITDRDLRTALLRPNLTVGDIMTTNPVTIQGDASLESAILILRKKKFNALPVVSESRELIGIITVTDVLDALINLLGPEETQARLRVEVTEGDSLPLREIISIIESEGGEVLSVMSERKDRKSYYICLTNCDVKNIAERLREKGARCRDIGI